MLSVTEPGDAEYADDTRESGTRTLVEAGQKGYSVVTYRVIYENGAEIGRVEESRSHYQKQDRLWAVGTARKASEQTPAWLR